MPNWCDNTAQFYHPVEQVVEELATELSKRGPEENGEPFVGQLFNHLYPRPTEQQENWYQWNIDNWGTKWDADIFEWERTDKNTITVYFNTAWAPPTALYEHIEQNGWMVSALYHEPGMVFIGRFVDGSDQYFEYDITDEDSLLEIPEELIEWANLREAFEEYQEDNQDEN
jgi:hypothetical protein